MKPRIDSVRFGSITVDGTRFDHDIVLMPDGRVKKRKKKISKKTYGTSHILSLAEIEKTVESASIEILIVGTGHLHRVRLSDEAAEYLAHRQCQVKLCPTNKAAKLWNELEGRVLGLFHITC